MHSCALTVGGPRCAEANASSGKSSIRRLDPDHVIFLCGRCYTDRTLHQHCVLTQAKGVTGVL